MVHHWQNILLRHAPLAVPKTLLMPCKELFTQTDIHHSEKSLRACSTLELLSGRQSNGFELSHNSYYHKTVFKSEPCCWLDISFFSHWICWFLPWHHPCLIQETPRPRSCGSLAGPRSDPHRQSWNCLLKKVPKKNGRKTTKTHNIYRLYISDSYSFRI